MKPHRRSWLANCVAALAATPALAQAVSGRVVSFDNGPAAYAVVQVLSESGAKIAELLADADGRFAYSGEVPIDRLRVQCEAVTCNVPIANGAELGLNIPFAGQPHFTLRGHVVDPGGAPAADIDVACRDEYGGTVLTLTTDKKGAFAVRANETIADFLVDPLGWAQVEPGPFTADRGVAIDLRLVQDDYYRITGTVLDLDGKFVVDALVAGMTAAGRAGSTRSRADGRFSLWCRQPIREIRASFGDGRIVLAGDWQRHNVAALDERTHGLVTVRGRLTDGAGRPISALFFETPDKSPPDRTGNACGSTNRRGEFTLRVNRSAPFVAAVHAHEGVLMYVAGPWTDAPMELAVNRR